MKKILITGSHGFLARHTAYLLKKKHCKIHGIGNGKWTKKQYKKWGYNYLINGKVNLNNLLKYFNKFDYVVHCAGSGTVGLSSQEDFKKNIIPIKSVLKFVKLKSPNSKIIFYLVILFMEIITSIQLKKILRLNQYLTML